MHCEWLFGHHFPSHDIHCHFFSTPFHSACDMCMVGYFTFKMPLTPAYYMSSVLENTFFFFRFTCTVVQLHISQPSSSTYIHLSHFHMPSSHSYSSSPPYSFQTYVWNPGVLACLTPTLLPVDLPITHQTRIQVSQSSSPFPYSPHPLSWSHRLKTMIG